MRAGGISLRNRHLLEQLHRGARGPFTIKEAAALLSLDETRTRRLLRYLAGRGWLARARRGLYVTVPLEAARSGEWTEDPWVLAAKAFSPCYVGGWSACEYWSLTDQVFRDLLVFTTRRVRNRSIELQGMPIKLRRTAASMVFGTKSVWRGQTRVAVSDASRTVIDILRHPDLGGGMRHVADIVRAYLDSEYRDDQLLIEYGDIIGNRTVFKRLGYLLELGAPQANRLLAACRKRISSGVTVLDPSIVTKGQINRRWGLRINVDLAPPE